MRYFSLLLITTFILACKKKDTNVDPVNIDLSNGAVVLCEGLFQQNNSSLSFMDFTSGSIDNQFFVTTTNRQLGDTGNDMKRYGGKIYIVVNVSSVVEVVSAKDFSSIKQIEMQDGGIAKQPRYITFYGGNAYVSCYDGYVDVIDTTTLTVTTRIPVGSNPEGLVVQNNKLYVANSGGLNFPNVDSTLSIIDLTTNSELSRITVGLNPGSVVADNEGDVYVISRGNYGTVPSRLKRVDSNTDQLVDEFTFDITGISPFDLNFIVFTNSGASTFDPTTEAIITANLIDFSSVITPYNVVYHSVDSKIYVLDAMNYTNTGYVRKFDLAGNLLDSYHVGLNPSKILFYD